MGGQQLMSMIFWALASWKWCRT